MNACNESTVLKVAMEIPTIIKATDITNLPPYLSWRYPITTYDKAPTKIPSDKTLDIVERLHSRSLSIGVIKTPIDEREPELTTVMKKHTAKINQP